MLEHYSAIEFPPPRNYKLNKVSTEVNHVVRKDSFDKKPLILNLVKCFDQLYQHLKVQIVWFICKSVNGNGFPAWHQDLVKNSTIAVAIVVNVFPFQKRMMMFGHT